MKINTKPLALHLNLAPTNKVHGHPTQKHGDIIGHTHGKARFQGDVRRVKGGHVKGFAAPRVPMPEYLAHLGTDSQGTRDVKEIDLPVEARAEFKELREIERAKGRLICGKPLSAEQAEQWAARLAAEFGRKREKK